MPGRRSAAGAPEAPSAAAAQQVRRACGRLLCSSPAHHRPNAEHLWRGFAATQHLLRQLSQTWDHWNMRIQPLPWHARWA